MKEPCGSYLYHALCGNNFNEVGDIIVVKIFNKYTFIIRIFVTNFTFGRKYASYAIVL